MEQKKMPKQSIYVTIEKNEYEVKYPNSGEELDIILMIQSLANNKYDSLKLSPFVKLQREALKCEAIAHVVVLIPKLKKDLNVKSLLDLSHQQMDSVIEAYSEHIYPWLEEWETIFNEPKNSSADETKK